MYRAGIEGIVGLTRHGETLFLNPTLPRSWPELSVTIALGAAHYDVTIRNPDACGQGIRAASLNGKPLQVAHDGLAFPLLDGNHQLVVVLGPPTA